ncbi:MAG: DUF1475 family protein [Candidatus Competibacteraceae bacterium]
MLRITIVVCGVLLGILVAAILAASSHSHVVSGLQYVLADPWGAVTLLDLSIGLLFVAAWLSVMEPRPLRAALWIVALFALGNVTTLVFLLCRTRQVQHFSELFLPVLRNE